MGTDIHLYIESDSGKGEPFSDKSTVTAFTEKQIFMPRSYWLFHALAGVRDQSADDCLIKPKGIPVILSDDIATEYFEDVFDEGEKLRGEYPIKREMADDWVAKGKSEYRDSYNKKNGWVSLPDWHSASFLDLTEIMMAMDHIHVTLRQVPVEFSVVVAALKEFENEYGLGRARIVFWFDN